MSVTTATVMPIARAVLVPGEGEGDGTGAGGVKLLEGE